LIRAWLPTRIGPESSRCTRVIVGVIEGQRATSIVMSHTVSTGASITTVFSNRMQPLYHLVHAIGQGRPPRTCPGLRRAGGVADKSLREIAAGVGTSHRMLLYHFGSREGVLVAIVAEVERQQRAVMETLTGTDEDRMWGLWRQVSDPALRPYVRLFFSTVGLAVQGVRAPGRCSTPSPIHGWKAATPETRAALRLGVAATRGLLLDLLAGADPDEVDAAYRLLIELWGRER
jgi:AcrR family transcriptional regulator